jgi:hypothetical protein
VVRAPRSQSKITRLMIGFTSRKHRDSRLLATTPGCRQLMLVPVPDSRRASAYRVQDGGQLGLRVRCRGTITRTRIGDGREVDATAVVNPRSTWCRTD